MKKSIIKSPGGLWYERWDPVIESPLNRVLICCIQGSGEFGSYTAADMNAEVSRIVEKSGFAQDAAAGEELPFIIIAPLATKGPSIADHSLIAREIGSIAKSVDVDYRFVGGLSLGGQTTAGLLFQAKTSAELTAKLPSSYLNADIFDGFFMFAGQAPVATDPCAFPNKYVFMVHATGDGAIKVEQSFTMMRLLNGCSSRTQKISANYYQKWTSPVSYLPSDFDSSAVNRLFVIPGGSHSTSWTEAYNWRGPVGTAGYEFRKWIETICIPKAQKDIPGIVIKRGSTVYGKFEDGTEIVLNN